MTKREGIRWTLLPVAAIGSCRATEMVGRGVQGWFETRFGLPQVELVLPLDARESIWYFLAAFAFVVAGAAVAPRARALVALVLLGCGAWLAWVVLNAWYFPEFHPRGYEISQLPLWGTWAGGLCALMVVQLPSVRRALATLGD